MSRFLNKQDIIEILHGATLLASGGGGPLKLGIRLIEETDAKEPIRLEMFDVEEMEAQTYGAMNAILGSPVAMEKNDFDFADGCEAFLGFREELKRSGKDLKYIYSGEFGGMNTAIPIYTAIATKTPLLDLDTNMRAVPELNTGVLPNQGKPAYPVVLSNTKGDVTCAYSKDPNDSKAAETIARALCMAYGMKIGFATWALNKDEIKSLLTPGSLSYAQKAGKALLKAKEEKADIFEALRAHIPCSKLGVGMIENVELVQEDGFDFGTTTIALDTGRVTIDFKNEHMLLKDESGKVILTVPDTICLVQTDTYEPLTNDQVKAGQHVTVLTAPCAQMWNFPEGYGCFKHILQKMGYNGERVAY